MSDELREKMRRLIVLHITSSGHTVDELTDAAIALIRADTLEEAEARIEQLEAALREIKRGAVWNADIEVFISAALEERA